MGDIRISELDYLDDSNHCLYYVLTIDDVRTIYVM